MTKYISDKIRKKSGARLAAIQAFYMIAFSDNSVDEVINNFVTDQVGRFAITEDMMNGENIVQLEEIDKAYFEKLVRNVQLNKEELENSLRLFLKEGSNLDQMSTTMQALLLNGVYELNFNNEIDKKVIIQEYVDLAYAFFLKNEPKMINAILDQVSKSLAA